MNVQGLRSPHEKTRGIVYFARMLDKIRLHSEGRLPEDYQANLGGGFDDFCCRFLGLDYAALVERVKSGGSDEEILSWAFQQGREPSENEITVWNDFMRKRGWNDGVSSRLTMRKNESGLAQRDDILTFFDFIDADEGRAPAHRS